MTGRERDELAVAIGLIHDLRGEMNEGFREVREEINSLALKTAKAETIHCQEEKASATTRERIRWAHQVLIAAAVTTSLWVAGQIVSVLRP